MTAARETFRARSRAEGDPGRRCSWRLLARTALPDTPEPAPDPHRSGAWPYAVVAALCAAAVLAAAAITGPDTAPAPPAPAAEDALGGMTSGGTR